MPFATAQAWAAPQKAANSRSRSRTSSPWTYAVLERTRATASSISGRMRASWALRSMMGIGSVVGHGRHPIAAARKRPPRGSGRATSGREAASASRFGKPPGTPTAKTPAAFAIATSSGLSPT